MLTDADQAMAAALREWKTTLHLWCLWHLNKNVVKHCSSSFPDTKGREKMLRLFKNAAYAATPEVRIVWVGLQLDFILLPSWSALPPLPRVPSPVF